MSENDDKAQLRKAATATRARCRAAAGNAGQQACRHFMESIGFPSGGAVSAYLPVKDEFDVLPIALTAHVLGHLVGMPVVAGRGKPLVFREWTPETPLIVGALGIPVPPEDALALVPRLLLVPMLAFDRAGYRLGYGGGFYDRTLAALRALDPRTVAVGVAYAGQQVEAVPRGPHDEPLDWIVTEEGTQAFG
jgi:5-formyltetrahydrofolate cyclo-ligase